MEATASRWDAIVVGSGVGGCVTSALLAHRGARVLVLEKNSRPGGILASIERAGFKMDYGSHLISRGARGPLGAVLRELGLTRPRFLTHRIPVRSRGIFQMDAPEHRSGLPRVAREVVRAMHIPPRDVSRLARMLFQVFTLTEPELRRWDRLTLSEFIFQHTQHPGAYFLFSFLASIFFVLPPWRVSAGESIRCLRWLLRDYSLSYVEGGMDRLAAALLGVVRGAGGEVVTGKQAVSIRERGGMLRVSTADGGEYDAPAVACNLAPADLAGLLEDPPAEWAWRALHTEPSGNAHQLKLALRRPLVDEGCIIGGISFDGLTVDDLDIPLMERTVDAIESGRITDPLAVYAPVPTNYDPSLAPEGRQLIVCSIYGPVIDGEDGLDAWRRRSLDAMARIIPGLYDELLFHEFIPISGVGRWMGKASRGAISNAQVPGQVGRDRLPVATPVPGLFLCGDGAGGRGIGTELAARSGREAAHQILQRAARTVAP